MRGGRNGAYAHYGVAKAGIAMYTRYLAQDLGSSGITVNCIAPGYVATGRLALAFESMESDTLVSINAMNALGRPATTEDCARVVGFLAGEESDYLSGVVLPIDGASCLERWAVDRTVDQLVERDGNSSSRRSSSAASGVGPPGPPATCPAIPARRCRGAARSPPDRVAGDARATSVGVIGGPLPSPRRPQHRSEPEGPGGDQGGAGGLAVGGPVPGGGIAALGHDLDGPSQVVDDPPGGSQEVVVVPVAVGLHLVSPGGDLVDDVPIAFDE